MESAPEAGTPEKHWPQAFKSWSRHQLFGAVTHVEEGHCVL